MGHTECVGGREGEQAVTTQRMATVKAAWYQGFLLSYCSRCACSTD